MSNNKINKNIINNNIKQDQKYSFFTKQGSPDKGTITKQDIINAARRQKEKNKPKESE